MVGDLTIRGVTREVKLEVGYDGRGRDPWGGERVSFSATGKIDRRDFGLTWNQALRPAESWSATRSRSQSRPRPSAQPDGLMSRGSSSPAHGHSFPRLPERHSSRHAGRNCFRCEDVIEAPADVAAARIGAVAATS